MNALSFADRMRGRALATVACASLVLPLAAPAAAQGVSDVGPAAATLAVAAPQGIGTKKRVVLLVGAAALYYLYRRHQNAKAAGATAPAAGQPVYYLSKNGQVYYRDATARVHWVTPPSQGIAVPTDEAKAYQGLQGYDRSKDGETNLARFASRTG